MVNDLSGLLQKRLNLRVAFQLLERRHTSSIRGKPQMRTKPKLSISNSALTEHYGHLYSDRLTLTPPPLTGGQENTEAEFHY